MNEKTLTENLTVIGEAMRASRVDLQKAPRPTKAQANLVNRVQAAGPLIQDNTEDGVRFSLAKGGCVSAATVRCCIAQGLLRPVGDGLLEDTTQTFTA